MTRKVHLIKLKLIDEGDFGRDLRNVKLGEMRYFI